MCGVAGDLFVRHPFGCDQSAIASPSVRSDLHPAVEWRQWQSWSWLVLPAVLLTTSYANDSEQLYALRVLQRFDGAHASQGHMSLLQGRRGWRGWRGWCGWRRGWYGGYVVVVVVVVVVV